jgi:hypothetical protein
MIGVSTLALTLLHHSAEAPTTAITIVIVLVVAALSPREAQEEPVLRLVDSVVGVGVGLGVSA